jgi:hypothetical protein
MRAAMNNLCKHRDYPASWRRDPFDRDRNIDALVAELTALAALAVESSSPTHSLARNLTEIGRSIADATRLDPVSARDYDGLEARLRDSAHHRRGRDQGRSHYHLWGSCARRGARAPRSGQARS